MCCFSADVTYVGHTQIYARGRDDGYQYVVYAMAYAAEMDLAMILPVPTPPRTDPADIEWIDLSGYPEFFDDLRRARQLSRSLGLEGKSKDVDTLPIVEVGSFEASFVPHQDDFARLDQRFSIPKAIWSQIPVYKDYGFAVFKLKAGEKRVHPMAFAFPRCQATDLFFPTVHIHHHEVEDIAHFEHELFYQMDELLTRPLAEALPQGTGFTFLNPLEGFVDFDRAQGIVVQGPGVLLRLQGDLPNRDIILPDHRNPIFP